jgi:CBS domain-containing protein
VKRIKDLRTRAVGTHGIQRDATVSEAVREFLDKGISALVVYDGERLAGIFTKNDLVRCCAKCPDGIRDVKVEDFMKKDVFTASIHSDLNEVIEVMVEKGFRHVPILDGDRVVGMVTPIDILVYQKGHLSGERKELIRYIQGLY